jgi:hypothetical protein
MKAFACTLAAVAAIVTGAVGFASPANAEVGQFAVIAHSQSTRIAAVVVTDRAASVDDLRAQGVSACQQQSHGAPDCKALATTNRNPGEGPQCIAVVEDAATGNAAGSFGTTVEEASAKAFGEAAADNIVVAPGSAVIQSVCI